MCGAGGRHWGSRVAGVPEGERQSPSGSISRLCLTARRMPVEEGEEQDNEEAGICGNLLSLCA